MLPRFLASALNLRRKFLAQGALAAVTLGAFCVATAAAEPIVYADTLTLLPNTPDQEVKIFVSGNETVRGENLNFQINSAITGPTITGVDIITGTIFETSNRGQVHPNDPGFDAQGIYTVAPYAGRLAVVMTVTRGTDSTTDNGLLATLHISTTGISDGSFTLNMINTLNGPSNFGTGGSGTLAMTFPNNQFAIAPEPASLAILGAGAMLFALRRKVRALVK